MTTMRREKIKCAICGFEGEYHMICSTSCFGPCDLDTRPAPLLRHALPDQIHICPKCGYANNDVSEVDYSNIKDVLKSTKYQKIYKSDLNESVKGYCLLAVIAEENKDYNTAGYNYLKAAWLCDDLFDNNMAIELRGEAIKDYLKILEEKEDNTNKLVLLDLYRRTNQFEQAMAFAEKIVIENDEMLLAIRDYEIKLIKNRDSDCHNLGEIM